MKRLKIVRKIGYGFYLYFNDCNSCSWIYSLQFGKLGIRHVGLLSIDEIIFHLKVRLEEQIRIW